MNRLRDYINNSNKQQAIIVMLLGAFAVIASAFCVQSFTPEAATVSWALLEGLSTIGIAFVGFGFFGLLIDQKNWRDYFSERIKEIVIEKEYLTSLDASTLKDLQINALKAQFKNPDIDKQGSFLQYFNSNLHKYISEPYREDVSTELFVKIENGKLVIEDKVTYICRASNGEIQKRIRWKPDDGEFEEVTSLTVEICLPNEASPKALYEKSGIDLTEDLASENGVDVDLQQYINHDGLRVTVISAYKTSFSRFQYWQMAHPTKNFDITIQYPDSMKIQHKALFVDDIDKIVTTNTGYLKLRYNSWLVPQSGIAWLLSNTDT
ncbi:MAG: hypothetical protein RL497_2563 [Pseudomonadota bacterium]